MALFLYFEFKATIFVLKRKSMSLDEIFNLFLLFSALHGFLFCFIIFFSKNGREKSMVFINLLMLVISLNNLQSWVVAKNYFANNLFLDYLQIPWHFLIAPFFYTFLIYYLEIKKGSKNILKVLLFIFLILILIRISFVSFFSDENTIDIQFLFEKYSVFEEIFSLLISLSIFGYAFYILSKKEQLFTKILAFDNLKWIYTFFKLGLLTYIFWIVALAITVALNFEEFIYSYYPLRVLTTVLIYWIGYQAILQLSLLKERKVLREKINIKTILVDKKVIFDKKNADKKAIFNAIETLLNEEKLYTAPKLTIDFLANKIDVNAAKLSTIIKLYSDKNFNDYINDFRIELAKDLLTDEAYQEYTITAIGLESGFNSKSAFFSCFKDQTGFTPYAFKKKSKKKVF